MPTVVWPVPRKTAAPALLPLPSTRSAVVSRARERPHCPARRRCRCRSPHDASGTPYGCLALPPTAHERRLVASLQINFPGDVPVAAESWADPHRAFMWTPAINKALGAQMGWAKVFEDLEGQVAVITGGARGLGLSMAQALAKWRAKIALLDVLAEVKAVQQRFSATWTLRAWVW